MKVEKLAAGDANGIHSVLRYACQGWLPHRMVFEVRATRIEAQVAIQGPVKGDLEGVGRWRFAHAGAVSSVRYEWHVHSTRW